MPPSLVRRAARPFAATLARRWPRNSRLFLVGDRAGWSIDHDVDELRAIASGLGVRIGDPRFLGSSRDQVVFYASQFELLREPWVASTNRLGTAYFHGRPGTPGAPEFDDAYRILRERHRELARVLVTHGEMHDLVLSSGIDPAKVFRIPIGVNLAYFAPQTTETRAAARRELDLPANAFVVGSFQKDGVGFGDGLEPKPIKGPDVLLTAFARLRESVPELHVLLGGPARGYVRAGLERLRIPYRHRVVSRYEQIGLLYEALDAYVVASRQEGGPKGVFEAMASGIPVVTTRVGQAGELVAHGENGWVVEVDDGDGLGAWLEHIARRPAELAHVVAAGLDTAGANSYQAQLPLWRSFLDGFVELP